MAFFNIRQWIDRISEHPNRRTLTNVEDATDVKTYDLSRAEGDVSVQGTAITGANLTDLENRIGAAFTAVENAMPEANPAETATASLTKLKVDGTVYEVEGGGGGTTIEKITKAEWDAMTAEEREAFIGVVEDTNADYVPLTADNIPYDSENSIAEKVEKLTIKLTLAEYNALTEKAPNTRYIITDAPALEYTADDLSYDGGTETTKQKIEEKANTSDLPTASLVSFNTSKWSSKTSNREIRITKYGKVVSMYIVFTLTSALSANESIISNGGVPPIGLNQNEYQFPITCVSGTNAGKSARVRISKEGGISDWYSQNTFFASSCTFLMNATYITD